MSVGAAVRAVIGRELTSHRRGRLVWWGAALTAVGLLGLGDARGHLPSALPVSVLLLTLVTSALVTGRIGDDLERGALQLDLLAGASSAAIVVGTVVGVLLATLPSVAIALAIIWPALQPLALPDVAVLALASGALLAAWAALGATLGALFTGKANAALLFPLAMVGALSPAALPLDALPAPLALLAERLWAALPLAHHLSSIASAIANGATPPLVALTTLIVDAALLPLAAVAVLQLRIATGRWTG
jgi:hypothetical protein